MLGDIVAKGTDFQAAKLASYPSHAAFQRCLSAGGIRKPSSEVVDLQLDKNSGLGFYILKCGHAMPVPSASKARPPEPGKRTYRPCAHCARVRFEKNDPLVAVEFATWVRQQLRQQQDSEITHIEPSRREAIGTAIERFRLADRIAGRRALNAAEAGTPAAA